MKRRASESAVAATVVGVAAAALAVGLIVSLFGFGRTRNLLPRGVYLGEVNVGGLTIDQALTRTVSALNEPIILRYQNQVVPMEPRMVDFSVNDAVARLSLQQLLAKQQGLAAYPAWLNELLGARAPAPTLMNTPFNYSEAKLASFLSILSLQINRPVIAATAVNGALSAPQDGLQLNPAETGDLLLKALGSPTQRVVELPVDVIPSEGRSIKALALLVASQFKTFNDTPGNISAVYVKDLRTGEEVAINADLSFSARGWLRVAVALEAARSLEMSTGSPLVNQLNGALVAGSDEAANELLRAIGNGNAAAGINQTNALLRKLGLTSMFIAAPWGVVSDPVSILTPGNGRSEAAGMRLVPDAQSTPAEIGLLLESIDMCANGGSGPLALVFARKVSKPQCDVLMGALAQNPSNVLLGAGSGSAVIHRQSWSDNTHADAALVRSPNGGYIIVAALHGKALDWGATAVTFNRLARSTFAYFNDGKAPADKTPGTLPPAQ